MPNKIIKNLLIIVLLNLTTEVVATTPSPVQQFKNFLATTKSLTANFKQISLNKNGKVLNTSQGLFFLNRPEKFRWIYKKPFAQEIISNGKTIWLYDIDLEQVTLKKIDTLYSTPALLLSGKLDLVENFIIQSEADANTIRIKFFPKNQDSAFNYIIISMKNNVLNTMELMNNFDQLTKIYFFNSVINSPIDDAKFEFTIPKGVDVFLN